MIENIDIERWRYKIKETVALDQNLQNQQVIPDPMQPIEEDSAGSKKAWESRDRGTSSDDSKVKGRSGKKDKPSGKEKHDKTPAGFDPSHPNFFDVDTGDGSGDDSMVIEPTDDASMGVGQQPSSPEAVAAELDNQEVQTALVASLDYAQNGGMDAAQSLMEHPVIQGLSDEALDEMANQYQDMANNSGSDMEYKITNLNMRDAFEIIKEHRNDEF